MHYSFLPNFLGKNDIISSEFYLLINLLKELHVSFLGFLDLLKIDLRLKKQLNISQF